uniref:Uncharacterized protein n=1 Tax=Heterorhabditis bacteriophora TaxID=37862 RepID=A0A1I7X822_HETBA
MSILKSERLFGSETKSVEMLETMRQERICWIRQMCPSYILN